MGVFGRQSIYKILFVHQILLNFFVAVILDNLEYPEEKKQRKLEEEQQPKRERVPFHLRLFQYCKPKCVPAPKLSSTEAPILTGKVKLVFLGPNW